MRSRHIVNVADGTAVVDIERVRSRCVTDGERLIGCSSRGSPRLVSYLHGETEARISPVQSAESLLDVHVAFDGYLFTYDLGSGQTLAMDRAGSVLSDPLPGVAVRVTDQYAVFTTYEPTGGSFAVHLVTG